MRAPDRALTGNLAVIVGCVAVAAFVVLASPRPEDNPPTPTIVTDPAACAAGDDLCRAVDLLEDLRDDPRLTPAEREVLDAVAEGIQADTGATVPATSAPTPPSTTTSTTSSVPPSTTTTTTPPAIPAGAWADRILDDLLGGTDGEP